MDTKQVDLGMFNVKDIVFYTTEGGFAGLRFNGEDYNHVTLRRMMPIEMPMQYISVADHENKEIGILKEVDSLAPDQKEIVLRELDNRYYSPEILEVKSVKDKLGYVYMELRLLDKQRNEYNKSCAVKDVSRNIRMLSPTSVIIFDVDGNRYLIPSVENFDKQSLRKLDAYLF